MATRSSKTDSPVAEKKAAKPRTENKKAAIPTVIEQYFRRYANDTKGTLRFEAVSTKGVPLAQDKSEVSQLYVRRTSPAMGGDPKFLKITVEVLTKLPSKAAVVEDEE